RRISLRPPSARAGLAALGPTQPRRISLRPPSARAGLAALGPTQPRRISLRPPSARAGLAALGPTQPRRISLRPPPARAGLAALAPMSDGSAAPRRARLELLVRSQDDGDGFELRQIGSGVAFIQSRPQRVADDTFELAEVASRVDGQRSFILKNTVTDR